MSDTPQLQSEAVWALANVVAGTSECTKVVIEHGAVPMCVQLLSSPIYEVREQAIWVLGNVATDSPTSRDLVLNHGALLPLLRHLNEHSKVCTLKNGTWALSNFLWGKPPPPFKQVKPALHVLGQLIHLQDEEALAEVCLALSRLSDGPNDQIQAVIDAGVCPRLVELLAFFTTHSSHTILLRVLKTVGNIATGQIEHTQIMIDNKVLPCLYQLITQDHNKCIIEEACWTLSNILVGPKSQIQSVIDANIIPPLIHLLQNAEFIIKGEAAHAIRNLTTYGSYDQIQYLVKQDCIKPLCDLLINSDARIVYLCLDGLEKILKLDKIDKEKGLFKGINIYAEMIAECEGLEKIVILQAHDNDEIYEKSVNILEEYWAEELVEKDIDILPDAIQEDDFGSGSNQPINLPPGGFKFG